MNYPTKRYSVMIVDDNVTNLAVAKNTLSANYDVIPVTSGEKALYLLSRIIPNLILLDVEMPGMNGFEALKLIKRNPRLKNVPVIFLTVLDDSQNELEGLKLGAVDYISKPFSPALLLRRIEMHIDLINYTHNLQSMVAEKTEIIKELQNAIVHTITDLVERRDGSTGGHITRTQAYIKILMDGMKKRNLYSELFEKINYDMLIEASQLHDLGKIAIPDSILLKPGRLNRREFEIMKGHTLMGQSAILKAMNLTRDKEFFNYASVLALSHHEKWDGSGYPYQLRGNEIPLIGRLMAVADVYDALVSERPYKKAYPHEKAARIIQRDSGNHFDPNLIEIFTKEQELFRYTSETIE